MSDNNNDDSKYTSPETPTTNFTIGFIFSMGNTPQILYRVQSLNIPSNYAICRQIKNLQQYQTTNDGFPDIIHLTPKQLTFVQAIEPKLTQYQIGSQFTMANNNLFYEISHIDNHMNICQCQQMQYKPTNNESYEVISCADFPSLVYLTIDQLQFVHPLSKNIKNTTNNNLGVEIMERADSYVLSEDIEQDMKALETILPYFADFIQRKEQSVISNAELANNPRLYLQAILDKYNVEHPKNMANMDEYQLRPWIAGTMEKLMPEGNFLGKQKWETRVFRLFDEALVWFEDENFFKKIFNSKQLTMKPYGVLPLAMITGLKTGDIINKEDHEISEDDLLRLELEIEGEGVIVLKCADFNQRIKWFECLHTAIFTVARPMFTKKKGIWRIAEKDVKNENRRISAKDLVLESRQSRIIRMGTSLVLKLGKTSENFPLVKGKSIQMSEHIQVHEQKDNMDDSALDVNDDVEEVDVLGDEANLPLASHAKLESTSILVKMVNNDLKVL